MAYKKDEIEIYTDAINMVAYRSLDPKDFKELFMALFEYSNGKEIKADLSSDGLYDMLDEYKKKVDKDQEKYEQEKARKKKYYDNKKANKK